MRDRFNWLLREALANAASRPAEALALLDRGIVDANVRADTNAVARFARHAGVIAMHIGEVTRAATYFSLAVQAAPADGELRWALAKALEGCSRPREARIQYVAALSIFTTTNSGEWISIVTRELERLP